MQAVRAKGTGLERKLGSALWGAGLRYRKHYPVEGRPDFALVSSRIAVFCDSHFWHGYDWENRKRDHRHNVRFWHDKIERNMERDAEVNAALTQDGWLVIRFWEHEITDALSNCVSKVLAAHKARCEAWPPGTEQGPRRENADD